MKNGDDVAFLFVHLDFVYLEVRYFFLYLQYYGTYSKTNDVELRSHNCFTKTVSEIRDLRVDFFNFTMTFVRAVSATVRVTTSRLYTPKKLKGIPT